MWSFWRSMCRSVNRITDKRGNGCRPNLADMGKRWPSKWLTFGSDPDPRVYSRSVFFIFFTIFFQIFILHWYHCMVNKDSHCGMWDLWTFVSMLSCNQRPICNTLGEMAGADKIMHSQHFGTYPIDVRKSVFESRITFGWNFGVGGGLRRVLLFVLCQVKSDFDETWSEWYEGKGLRSYGADYEYLHKLC